MSRRHTETVRLKHGGLKPIYWHEEYDKPGGKIVDVWVSCSTKYGDQEMVALMEDISNRIQNVIQQRRSL
jgi:hypothetical protein